MSAGGTAGSPPLHRIVNGLWAPAVNVTHHGDEHLLRLSSEEVALLLDLCHAGLYSDLLGHDRAVPGRLMSFIGEIQQCLFGTAQTVWRRHSSRELECPPPLPGGEGCS